MNKEKFPENTLRDRIQVLGRHVQVTPAMKEYAIEKLSKLERFHSPGMHIVHVHVVMDIVHLQHTVQVIVHFGHFRMKASASTGDMYASVDLAMEKLHSQFAKWKDRMVAYSHKKKPVVDMPVRLVQKPSDEVEEFNAEIEAHNAKQQAKLVPMVMGREVVHLKELTRDEAVMKMELSGDAFLVYRSEEDRRLKVLYRRTDGNYGILEPE
ncbi:MAG: ribosome-associated translation inhibitor RaiA [Chlamydiae bacterium]|nr:ribosome-associated translation inhibitor RaiA [Chlamydiota bacterium]